MKNTLIIFVRNPELGKVKSRLAQSVGDEKALLIYKKLLERAKKTIIKTNLRKVVYYSNRVDADDIWESNVFVKKVQRGAGLGDRMYNALRREEEEGSKKICLIGSDIPRLSKKIIKEAFDLLEDRDVVLGPADDGGYYLIGMKKTLKALFTDKPWGTDRVLGKTVSEMIDLQLSFALLPVLRDIDTVEDLVLEGLGDWLN